MQHERYRQWITRHISPSCGNGFDAHQIVLRVSVVPVNSGQWGCGMLLATLRELRQLKSPVATYSAIDGESVRALKRTRTDAEWVCLQRIDGRDIDEDVLTSKVLPSGISFPLRMREEENIYGTGKDSRTASLFFLGSGQWEKWMNSPSPQYPAG